MLSVNIHWTTHDVKGLTDHSGRVSSHRICLLLQRLQPFLDFLWDRRLFFMARLVPEMLYMLEVFFHVRVFGSPTLVRSGSSYNCSAALRALSACAMLS